MADPLPEQIRARHQPEQLNNGEEVMAFCRFCKDKWPCDASLLLAALSDAEAEREDYAKFYRYWRDRAEAAEAAIEGERAVRVQYHEAAKELGLRVQSAEARLEAVEGALREAQSLVNEQAEDEGLWFIADSIVEAYLQQELRRLTAVIESVAPERAEGEPDFPNDEYERDLLDRIVDRFEAAALAQEHTEPQEQP